MEAVDRGELRRELPAPEVTPAISATIATVREGAADPANLAGLVAEIGQTDDAAPSHTVKTRNGAAHTPLRGRHKLREGEPREWLAIGRQDRWRDRED